MIIRTALSYDDVLMVPKKFNGPSRDSIDLSSWLDKKRGMVFSLPVITSPMDTVTEDRMAIQMARLGGLGILHRYNTIREQVSMLKKVLEVIDPKKVGVAIGVNGDAEERAKALIDNGCLILCVDVAHGHMEKVGDFVANLRDIIIPSSVHIMAGNIATANGYMFLTNCGADSVRCSIGGGSICATRKVSGHGVPTLQAIIDIHEGNGYRDKPIIADGGIKDTGDMVKALGAGASFVMVGSMVAGTNEAAGEFTSNGQKAYRGMASVKAQKEWRGYASSVEGVATMVKDKGPLEDVVEAIDKGLRTGFSYGGAMDLRELQEKAEFIIQTQSGQYESSTHILTAK